jgi:hypothetical protein
MYISSASYLDVRIYLMQTNVHCFMLFNTILSNAAHITVYICLHKIYIIIWMYLKSINLPCTHIMFYGT